MNQFVLVKASSFSSVKILEKCCLSTVIVVLIFLASCKSKKETTPVIDQAPQYTIHLKDSSSNLITKFETIFTDAKIIPLRTPDSVFVASIGKVVNYKGRFYILDNKFSHLYAFDSSGLFQLSYGTIGLGLNEFKKISDFDIDKATNQIVIYSSDDMALYYYSLNKASFLKRKNIGVSGSEISLLDDKNVLIYSDYSVNSKRSNNVFLIDSLSHSKTGYFPFDMKLSKYGWKSTGFLKKAQDSIFTTSAFNDTVYVYKNNNFTPYAHIDINSDSIRKYKVDHDKLLTSKILLAPATSYLGSCFLNNSDYSIFNFQYERRMQIGIYNKRNGKIKILSRIVQSDAFINLIKEPLELNDDNTVLFSITPDDILFLKTNLPSIYSSLSLENLNVIRNVNNLSNNYLLTARLK